jgi:phosphinothricin acetyltransferase
MTIDPIRVATTDDAEAILSIYAPMVQNSAISFELEPPTIEEMRNRIANTLTQHPWLIFERNNEVLGYAYAHSFRPRLAYQWSTEVSVYVDGRARRLGVARTLYSRLFSILTKQGYYDAHAVITLPNPASVTLHELFGFKPVGVLHNVGYKLGRWHDVGYWQLVMQPHSDPAGAPKPFSELEK